MRKCSESNKILHFFLGNCLRYLLYSFSEKTFRRSRWLWILVSALEIIHPFLIELIHHFLCFFFLFFTLYLLLLTSGILSHQWTLPFSAPLLPVNPSLHPDPCLLDHCPSLTELERLSIWTPYYSSRSQCSGDNLWILLLWYMQKKDITGKGIILWTFIHEDTILSFMIRKNSWKGTTPLWMFKHLCISSYIVALVLRYFAGSRCCSKVWNLAFTAPWGLAATRGPTLDYARHSWQRMCDSRLEYCV